MIVTFHPLHGFVFNPPIMPTDDSVQYGFLFGRQQRVLKGPESQKIQV